jgi:predicted Zn-dependent peptidase
MYEDDPKMNVLEGIKACLYKKPFGMSIAGTQESVMSISRADMLKKHAQYYIPSNSILAVVGNNSFEEVLELAEKLCPAGGGKVTSAARVELQNSKLAKKRADLQQTNLCIGFHLPTDLKYAIDVFISILGEGMSSKLFTEVREKRGLVYGIKAYQQVTNNFGYAVIFAGTEPSKAEEVIKISLEQFHKMKDISEADLEVGKNQVIGNFEVGFEDSSNVALSLVDEEIQGKAEDFYEYQKNIKKVSLEDIRKIASLTEYSTYLLG